MKKMLFMAATAALALASCTSEDALNQAAQKPAEDGAISFSTYIGRTVSRAASDEATATMAMNGGFGVFAYAQETTPLASYLSTSVVPNFMYNQQVKGWKNTDGTGAITDPTTETVKSWTYTPVKYFSNNPGALHSFFAYAPYMATGTGAGQLGTTSTNPRLLTNSIYGGPALEYTVDLNGGASGVDILCAQATVDFEKPNTTKTIDFHFQHALSSLKFNVQAWVDQLTDKTTCDPDGEDPALETETTIKVKSLKLIGNFAKKGVLRLVDGKWDTSSTASETIELIDPTNPFVLDKTNSKKENPLFDADSDNECDPIYFIPQDGDEVFKIQITYDVITTDDALSAGNSTITNTITSDLAYPLAQNTAYEYHLNLGMTTVKFDADVTDWTVKPVTEVALPENITPAP